MNRPPQLLRPALGGVTSYKDVMLWAGLFACGRIIMPLVLARLLCCYGLIQTEVLAIFSAAFLMQWIGAVLVMPLEAQGFRLFCRLSSH